MGYVRLTQRVIDQIVATIIEGYSNKTAISLAGCAESSFYSWLYRGKDDQAKGISSIYAELVERLDIAEAEREKSLVQIIVQDKSWKSKAWLLERLYPDRWGPMEKRDITLRQTTPDHIPVNLSALSNQEKEQLKEILDKALTSNGS